MARKPIPKKIREQVYAKYNGHCAYCGCELAYKDMQVDHIIPVMYAKYGTDEEREPILQMIEDGRMDSIDNLMPACRACNYYKSMSDIEGLRRKLQEVLMRNVRRPFDYRLAVKYGLVTENIHPIEFYFEKEL